MPFCCPLRMTVYCSTTRLPYHGTTAHGATYAFCPRWTFCPKNDVGVLCLRDMMAAFYRLCMPGYTDVVAATVKQDARRCAPAYATYRTRRTYGHARLPRYRICLLTHAARVATRTCRAAQHFPSRCLPAHLFPPAARPTPHTPPAARPLIRLCGFWWTWTVVGGWDGLVGRCCLYCGRDWICCASLPHAYTCLPGLLPATPRSTTRLPSPPRRCHLTCGLLPPPPTLPHLPTPCLPHLRCCRHTHCALGWIWVLGYIISILPCHADACGILPTSSAACLGIFSAGALYVALRTPYRCGVLLRHAVARAAAHLTPTCPRARFLSVSCLPFGSRALRHISRESWRAGFLRRYRAADIPCAAVACAAAVPSSATRRHCVAGYAYYA